MWPAADAHLLALALHPQWRNRGIGSALLRELDQEVIHHGAHRVLALVEPGQVGEVAFSHQGFERVDGLHLFVRAASMVPEELAIVERYGGHFPASGLWEDMKGFSSTKVLLNRRIVAPLSHSELAERIGLRAPAAVMLFGPPGTGKTSFARAIASRLSWAFVELHPSLLGHGTEAAASLRGALADLGHVDRLVCFIDEADEIASARDARPESQPIVNELLKAIPIFKSRPGRLMVMATNSIAAIDPALLRPGRFDLIVPVGAPDREGRKELAGEFLGRVTPPTWRSAPRASHRPTSRWREQRGGATRLRAGARWRRRRGHLHRLSRCRVPHQALGQQGSRSGVRRRGRHLRPALTPGLAFRYPAAATTGADPDMVSRRT